MNPPPVLNDLFPAAVNDYLDSIPFLAPSALKAMGRPAPAGALPAVEKWALDSLVADTADDDLKKLARAAALTVAFNTAAGSASRSAARQTTAPTAGVFLAFDEDFAFALRNES